MAMESTAALMTGLVGTYGPSAGKYTIREYTTVFGPWEDGADTREVIRTGEDEIDVSGDEFDSPVADALSWLRKEGFGSEEGCAWLTASYDHPYTDELEERSEERR